MIDVYFFQVFKNLVKNGFSYLGEKYVFLTIVAFAVTGFALPFRCLCCTELYKELVKRNYAGKIAAEKLAQRAQSTRKAKKNIGDED